MTSENILNSINQELFEYALEELELGWINDLISLQNGLQKISELYASKPNICNAIFDYHIQNDKYSLYFTLNDNQTLGIQEIKDFVNYA